MVVDQARKDADGSISGMRGCIGQIIASFLLSMMNQSNVWMDREAGKSSLHLADCRN
jgi:hypothetical protein